MPGMSSMPGMGPVICGSGVCVATLSNTTVEVLVRRVWADAAPADKNPISAARSRPNNPDLHHSRHLFTAA